MTTVKSVSSERPATKRPLNEFLFRIVNSFNLDEFKKYTNFSDLMKEVVARREASAPQRFSLHDRIRHNFKHNVPDESKWRRGGFKDLKLTTDFYGSDVAARIFRNVYGIEESFVPLGLPTEVRHNADLEEQRLQLSSAEDNVIAKVDLTKSDDSSINISNAPKRRPIYPRKNAIQLDKSTSISGIRTYTSTSEFVEKITVSRSPEGFDDEIIVSSTEPAATSSKRVEVISEVVLAPPTPFRDQTIQRQPDPNSDSLRNKASNQKPGPKSKISQRKVVYIDEDTDQLPTGLPATDATHKMSTPKIGPKSRMSQPKGSSVDALVKTTQDLLEDLMDTPPIVTDDKSPVEQFPAIAPPKRVQKLSSEVDAPTIKPRIGPKSVMANRRNLQAEELTEKSIHTGSSIESHIKKSTNVVFATPKIRPKSRITQAKSSPVDSNYQTTQDLLQDLMHTDPSPIDEQPNEPSQATAIDQLTSPHKTSLTRSQLNTKLNMENVDIEETPCQSFHVRQTYPSNQLHIGSQSEIYKSHQTHGEASLVGCNCVAGNDSPTECSDSSELRNIVKRSIERATEHMSKYFAEIDPNVQSLDHFWSDFHRFEAQDDSKAAETQLNSSIATPDDVELETQSQAILHPDQLEDKLQMEPQSSRVNEFEQEIVDKIKMEPESSVVDPHTDVEIKMKIKIEVVDHDRNSTSSSDVEIIELPADEPIEILLDDTQQLYEDLQVIRNDSEEQLFVPILIPQQPNKKVSPAATSSKGFLTSLPVIANKKRNYQPLDIVVEAVQKVPHEEFHAFSQQHLTPPSIEDYQIEECTMTESQHQRYALLNDENSIFLSSQLEHYAFNTGKNTDPKSAVLQNTDRAAQPLALKRLSQDVLNRQPHKRRRCDQTIKRELNWKTMDVRSITFKPLANHTFHLELQLRNNYDTFHVQDQSSIKRILHLSNNEWKHVARVLTALHGHRYDSSATATATRSSDLPSRLMDCFVQSIPMFVRSNIQFEDFMGNCLAVSEQQPLQNECVDAAIDPNILIKMGEFKKLLA